MLIITDKIVEKLTYDILTCQFFLLNWQISIFWSKIKFLSVFLGGIFEFASLLVVLDVRSKAAMISQKIHLL